MVSAEWALTECRRKARWYVGIMGHTPACAGSWHVADGEDGAPVIAETEAFGRTGGFAARRLREQRPLRRRTERREALPLPCREQSPRRRKP